VRQKSLLRPRGSTDEHLFPDKQTEASSSGPEQSGTVPFVPELLGASQVWSLRRCGFEAEEATRISFHPLTSLLGARKQESEEPARTVLRCKTWAVGTSCALLQGCVGGLSPRHRPQALVFILTSPLDPLGSS
jgi:hypothetical protein